MSDPVLRVHELSKSFGGVRALDGVSLDVAENEIVGIIGPNGSGKTTLINTITGVHRPGSGTVTWNGEDITSMPAHKIARRGLARTFQQAMAFAAMPVRENVAVALQHANTAFERPGLSTVEEIVAFVGLEALADEPAAALGFGHLRRLGVAIALASHPLMLMLDEPAAGLNDGETDDLRRLLADCREREMTIVMIDHDMNLMMSLCDRLVVLDFGRTIAEGTPAEIRDNREVLSVYLGEPL